MELTKGVKAEGIKHDTIRKMICPCSMMKSREVCVPMLCVLLLLVLGTAFCADGNQRATAIVVDEDSDDNSTSAGALIHRAVPSITATVREAQPPTTAAPQLQQGLERWRELSDGVIHQKEKQTNRNRAF